MRCTNCDYSLWNLTARACPECGETFRPSEYEFVPGSVQFCCPHCKQPYYGTGEKGHLQPVEFDCVQCGGHVHMDEMMLRPGEGLEERDTTVDSVPWLERRRIGFLKGWFGTIWKGMISPHRLMNAMPVSGTTSQSWGFMLLTVSISLLVLFGGSVLFMLAIAFLAGGSGVGFGAVFAGVFGVYWLACFLITIIFVLIWGLTAHGLLRLSGQTYETIGRTYSSLCIASGPFVLSAVPCLGMYVAMPWWIVAAVLTVYTAQRVSGWRAAMAVLAWPILSWILIAGGYFALIFLAIPQMQTGAANQQVAMQAASMQTAILQSGMSRQSDRPSHAGELVIRHGVSADNFILPGSYSQMTATPIGDTDLYSFSQADSSEQRRVVEAEIDALPENVIAHRLGDLVFTYHGMDLNPPNGDLWIMIACADPAQNPAAAINGTFHVWTAGWGRTGIEARLFDEELQRQNRLRAQHGLPPLPPPWTVKHAEPAVPESEESKSESQ